MPALSSDQLALLRTDGQKAKFYLSISRPRSLLVAQVNGAHDRGARTLTYNNGTGSGFSDIEAGHTLKVITSTGTKETRVKSISGNQFAGTIELAANSILWANGQIIEVLEDYPIKPKLPRFLTNVFYKDWFTTYAQAVDPHTEPNPVCNAGPHQVGLLQGGSATFTVNLSQRVQDGIEVGSYPIADGATIASYSLSVTPSTGVTVTNVSSGVYIVTVTEPGQYWLKASCTDSNGKTQNTRRRIIAHDLDPSDADYPYTDFEVQTLSGDYERGGWVLSIKVNGVADTDTFPEEALVILWYEPYYGESQAYVGGPVGGQNILFAGYIRKGTVVADWNYGSVSFEAETPQAMLRNISMRSVPLQAVPTPVEWYQYATWLTPGRAVHSYWLWHSTLLECCDVYGLTESLLKRQFCDFQKGDLYGQPDTFLREYSIVAHVVSNKAGQLYVLRDIQYLSDAERAAKPVVAEFTKADYRNSLTIIERTPLTTAMVYVSGLSFDGQTVTAICAKAPGYAPEDEGVTYINKDKQVLENQDHANSLAGRFHAVANNPYPEVRLSPAGIWAGVLDVAIQEWYQIDLSSDDTNRGISWTDKKIALRNVSNQVDPVSGYLSSECVFETEAEGPVGVEDTCVGLPGVPEPEPPKWEEGALEALIAFSSASYRDDNASDWTELQTRNYNHGDIDRFWHLKTGSKNPEDAIWWAAATGAIYKHIGINGSPIVRTPAEPPANTWSDSTPPAVSALTFQQILSDRWIKNRWFSLASYFVGGLWRGWLAYTTDDGLSWDYLNLYSGTLPTQIKPLWVAVNEDYILVTVWADETSDGLKLLVYNASTLAYVTRYDLGAATLVEVDARTYYAFPVTVLDDSNLWHVAGRMLDPAGLSGTQHVIKTANAGSSWSSVESGWNNDHCASLVVGNLDGSNRDYKAMRQPV